MKIKFYTYHDVTGALVYLDLKKIASVKVRRAEGSAEPTVSIFFFPDRGFSGTDGNVMLEGKEAEEFLADLRGDR